MQSSRKIAKAAVPGVLSRVLMIIVCLGFCKQLVHVN